MSYLDIELQSSHHKPVKLKDFKGQKVILYFYPKDNTSGCSLQAKDFTEYKQLFTDKGYTIIGVSRDSIKSHASFIETQNLEILLLSDPEEKLIKAFDVIKEKQMYGKTYLGIERSTFVLDENGEITKSYRGVKPKEHAAYLLSEL